MSTSSRRGPSAPPAAPRVRAPARGTILIVDDDGAARVALAGVLRRHGYAVVQAAGGREALTVAYERSAAPALLLASADLTGMGGVELAARLSADRPGLRVVLITSRPASAELARDRPELVAAVLLKPFGTDELLAAVVGALRPSDGPVQAERA